MSALDHYLPDGEPKEGEVIEYRKVVRYPHAPDVRLPQKPSTEIRQTGWLGGPNRQDLAHERRMRELYHLGREAAYFGEMTMAVEVYGIKATGEAVSKAEDIVYSLPPDSVAAQVTSDMAGEMAARARLRHIRLTETLDAEGLNIIKRH